MAIAKAAVEAHRGTVWVRTAPGEGFTATAVLALEHLSWTTEGPASSTPPDGPS